MVDLNIPDELSKEQQSRIISEIEAIKYNEMRIAKELDSYDREKFINKLKDEDKEKLIDFWSMYVGEWLLSRDDIDFGDDYEIWLENQWDKLLDGEKRDYTMRYKTKPQHI